MVAGACNPSYSGCWGRRIAWTQEAEVAVSQDHTIALQPEQQSENRPQKKNNKYLRWWDVQLSSFDFAHYINVSNYDVYPENIYTYYVPWKYAYYVATKGKKEKEQMNKWMNKWMNECKAAICLEATKRAVIRKSICKRFYSAWNI